jgi:hypothetical protein
VIVIAIIVSVGDDVEIWCAVHWIVHCCLAYGKARQAGRQASIENPEMGRSNDQVQLGSARQLFCLLAGLLTYTQALNALHGRGYISINTASPH